MPAHPFTTPDAGRSVDASPEADATEPSSRRAPVPPISVQKGVRVLNRWDLLAALLVLGVLVFLAEASRELTQPLAD